MRASRYRWLEYYWEGIKPCSAQHHLDDPHIFPVGRTKKNKYCVRMWPCRRGRGRGFYRNKLFVASASLHRARPLGLTLAVLCLHLFERGFYPYYTIPIPLFSRCSAAWTKKRRGGGAQFGRNQSYSSSLFSLGRTAINKHHQHLRWKFATIIEKSKYLCRYILYNYSLSNQNWFSMYFPRSKFLAVTVKNVFTVLLLHTMKENYVAYHKRW